MKYSDEKEQYLFKGNREEALGWKASCVEKRETRFGASEKIGRLARYAIREDSLKKGGTAEMYFRPCADLLCRDFIYFKTRREEDFYENV